MHWHGRLHFTSSFWLFILRGKDDCNPCRYPGTASSLRHQPYKFIWKNWNCIGTQMYLNHIVEIKPKKLLYTPDSGKSLIPLPRPIKLWTLSTAMASTNTNLWPNIWPMCQGSRAPLLGVVPVIAIHLIGLPCLSTCLPIWTWIWPAGFLNLNSGLDFSHFSWILQLCFQTWL